MIWAHIAGKPGIRSSGQASLSAGHQRADDLVQRMLCRLSRQRRHARPVRYRDVSQRTWTRRVPRDAENDEYRHDGAMLLGRLPRLIPPHHVPGLLAGYRVGQEGGSVREAFVCTVTAARKAALIA